MKNLDQEEILHIVKAALKEDIGSCDITTKLTVPSMKKTQATIVAKEEGVVCGLDVARLVFKKVDKNLRFRIQKQDGDKIKANTAFVHLEGAAGSILSAERVALNFLSHLSGIATLTAKYVERVRGYDVKIMDTRKTTPGLRTLEKYAVRCGGGSNHRMGLWDQVLIKDNHLSAFSYQLSAISLKDIIRKIKKKRPKGMKIEIEVKNLREFKETLLTKVDIIMLDNFDIKDIKKAVQIRNQIPDTRCRAVKLEASGGVSLDNVREIAATGVERISVGELTHSVKALDIALNCE
ncbi:MAG: carboxylating nicotinate-nucleotide diphosphorylase [Candidatus Omnitrophica bacterium]|nr:carboxylating nicotinate-nucleotide diphosphorylase [Candidatus Omnitrophota bacterium]